MRRAYVEVLLPRAATIHERISMEAEVKAPSEPPGWLTDHLTEWPHKTKKKSDGE